jgi:TPR repeat protein
MTKTAFYRVLLFVAATGATGCRCSDDAASQAGSSQFRALPPNSCTLKDIPGCTAACDQGDVQACATLGFIYLQRENRDLARAEAANKKACESGIQLACIRVAEGIVGSEDRRSEWPKAVAVYKSACDQDEHYGCYNLGKVYEAGKAVPADKAKAIELYTKACNREQGYIGACVRLWVAEGHAMPWKSRKGIAVTCMEDLGDCPPP